MTLILGTKETLPRSSASQNVYQSDNIFADYIAGSLLIVMKYIVRGVNYCSVPPNTNKKR